jgi:predicted nucleic acid-binding protein
MPIISSTPGGDIERLITSNKELVATVKSLVGPGPDEAYLDTNLVSGLAKGDASADELAALYKVIELMHAGRVRLVTSPVTKEQIEKVPAEHRAPHTAIYVLLAKLPTVDEEVAMPIIIKAPPNIYGPAVVQDEDLGKLLEVLPDVDDARHLFQAIKNGSAYFVTLDKKTILAHSGAIEARFPTIRVLTPSQLVAALDPS